MADQDATFEDKTKTARGALKKEATDVGAYRNMRTVVDQGAQDLHKEVRPSVCWSAEHLLNVFFYQARALGQGAAAEAAAARKAKLNPLTSKQSKREDCLKVIVDPAKRAQLEMEIAIRDHERKKEEEALAMALIREREFERLCPNVSRHGKVCNKPLRGSQVACDTHWAAIQRVSYKLLPDERNEVLTNRKRDRDAEALNARAENLKRMQGTLRRPAAQPAAIAVAAQSAIGPQPFPPNPNSRPLCLHCSKEMQTDDHCAKCNANVHIGCRELHAHRCPKK